MESDVEPACRVRLYLPRFSMTYALCCGTTVACANDDHGDEGESNKDVDVYMRESMASCLDVGRTRSVRPSRLHDAYTGTGWNRRIAVIAHGPEGAGRARLAALCGGRGDPSVITLRRSSVNWRTWPAAAVDAAPETSHRDDRQNSEDGPLATMRALGRPT